MQAVPAEVMLYKTDIQAGGDGTVGRTALRRCINYLEFGCASGDAHRDRKVVN